MVGLSFSALRHHRSLAIITLYRMVRPTEEREQLAQSGYVKVEQPEGEPRTSR